MKPGWKTTEFWLSLAALFIGAIVASGIVPATGPWSQVVGIITSVLGALGYTAARGFSKAGAAAAVAAIATASEVTPANPTPPKP